MALSKKIDHERLVQLNLGLVETANLMEGLAVSFPKLLSNTITNFVPPDLGEDAKITKLMQGYGLAMFEQLELDGSLHYTAHTSDTIRGLVCYSIAASERSVVEKFELLRPLADDSHFGVREWAWIAVRPEFNDKTIEVIKLLTPWASDASPNIRRYVCELTRPRGVWCAHNKTLKSNPKLALPILELLKNDSAKYVQLSVGNWLNDAGKDNPEWVRKLSQKWLLESPTESTEKIIKRGLRNLS